MKVSKLIGSSLRDACAIVPANIMNSADIVFGCKEQDLIAGVAAIAKKDDEWGIIWLYVMPQYRGKGAGGRLLDAAISMAEHEGVSILSSIMEADFADRSQVELMLARRQFLMTWKTVIRMRVTIEQLKKTDFLKTYPEEHLGKIQVTPLGKVASLTLNHFIKVAEKEGNLLVSRADYKNADGTKSMVLEKDGTIIGILLLQLEEQGQLCQVKLCYVDRQYKIYMVSMIKKSAEAVLNDVGSIKTIGFSCMDASVVKLGKHIFPEHELFENDVVFGECWL